MIGQTHRLPTLRVHREMGLGYIMISRDIVMVRRRDGRRRQYLVSTQGGPAEGYETGSGSSPSRCGLGRDNVWSQSLLVYALCPEPGILSECVRSDAVGERLLTNMDVLRDRCGSPSTMTPRS